MYCTKTFNHKNAEDLTILINTWLSKHLKYEPISISLTKTDSTDFTAIVLYKES